MTDTNVMAVKSDREARAKRMAEEGSKAREDYAASVEARDVNMARLKALRLEKERVEAEATAPAPAPKRRAAVKRIRRG